MTEPHIPMRDERKRLSDAETETILRDTTSGVLALIHPSGFPYAVPLSFTYTEGRLLFHAGVAGALLDAMAHDARASFCVVAQDDVDPAMFTTRYRSVIAFGRIRIHHGDDERRQALLALAEKYAPEHLDRADAEIERSRDRVTTFELAIESMTGRASIHIIRERAAGDASA